MQRFSSFLPDLVALLLALFSGILLFITVIFSSLVSTLINIGLDPLRSQLIAALLTAAGAALIGAIGGRRKLGAVLGAGAIFSFAYLTDFIQLELQPAHDPGGHLEPLNGGALVHTSLVMIALAILSAFIGAAVGVALGEMLFAPPFRLMRLAWQRARFTFTRTHDIPTIVHTEEITARISGARTVKGSIIASSGAVLMVVLLVLAAGSQDLFIYSPDIGLHSMPTLPHTSVLYGTTGKDSVASQALGGKREPFLVYLPPSYNTAQGKTKRYPTLYLLHGAPGSDRDWFSAGKADQSADTLIALHKIPELILILPDGNGRLGQSSEWGNSFDRRQNIETYVSKDLVHYVDAKYRTIAQAAYRGIGGNSMGGFGAMNIALHHPDVFGFVISLGGYYRAEGGTWGNNAAYMRANSPIDVLPSDKAAWRLQIYLGAASKDQPFYSGTMLFARELDQLHLSYKLDIQSGYHSWHVWQTQIYNALAWLDWGNRLSPTPNAPGQKHLRA